MLFFSWTLCQIRQFEFIRVEGGHEVHFKRGAKYKSLGTSGVEYIDPISWATLYVEFYCYTYFFDVSYVRRAENFLSCDVHQRRRRSVQWSLKY
jgi:hypothetical protein